MWEWFLIGHNNLIISLFKITQLSLTKEFWQINTDHHLIFQLFLQRINLKTMINLRQ